MANHTAVLNLTTGKMDISGVCPVTKKSWTLKGLDQFAYEAWRAGMLVQKAFPNLTPDERELLISGTSAEGWEQLFGGGDD